MLIIRTLTRTNIFKAIPIGIRFFRDFWQREFCEVTFPLWDLSPRASEKGLKKKKGIILSVTEYPLLVLAVDFNDNNSLHSSVDAKLLQQFFFHF